MPLAFPFLADGLGSCCISHFILLFFSFLLNHLVLGFLAFFLSFFLSFLLALEESLVLYCISEGLNLGHRRAGFI